MHDLLDSNTLPSNLTERNKRMYNNSLMSDVNFIVKESGTGNVVSIPAHKYVLSIGSPVFFRMFYGDLAEKSDSVEVVDADSESLLELLRFLYSDESKLTACCVLRVMYLAEKYMVTGLLDICANFLINDIDAENVFDLLTQCQHFRDTEKVQQRCWNIVDLQTRQCLASKSFLSTSQGILGALVKRKTLDIDEHQLFQAVLTWADAKFNMLDRNPQNIKEVLQDAISQIHVSLPEALAVFDRALECGVPVPDDLHESLTRFNNHDASPPAKRDRRDQLSRHRQGIKPFRCCRLSMKEAPPLFAPYESTRSFSFITDQPVCIFGVRIISSGRKVNNTYAVITKLQDGNCTCLSVAQATYTVACGGTEGLPGFDIYFNERVLVKSGTKYFIRIYSAVDLDLPQRIGKKDKVKCEGVNFYFPNSTHRQFSELIFHPLAPL